MNIHSNAQFSGFEWILIDLASRYGHDKLPFEDRLSFGSELIHLFKVDTLEKLKENIAPWLKEADEPEIIQAIREAQYAIN